jgi:transcriptional regulator with XRE-family HTH domain
VKLNTYVAREIEKTGSNKTTILRELAKKSGVSLLTLQGVERGATMRLFDKAKAISVATGGEVTVMELCDDSAMEVGPRAPVQKKTQKKVQKK